MKIFILEDEKPSMEMLADAIRQLNANMEICGSSHSVENAVRWLNEHPPPDLLFLDIRVSDGLSFDIFRHCQLQSPVIFVTAYDKYLLEAFEYNGIDYLLKPVSSQKLEAAVNKYQSLRKHFTQNLDELLHFIHSERRTRSRIIVKKGMEYQAIKTVDIAYFFTEHKLVFLVDRENRKYLADRHNLSELEQELDCQQFYRANRKFIININFIKRYKPLEKSKISVELVLPLDEEIIVSQENASFFKKWVSGL
jgi:two-component system LytT family response regulator